MPEPPLISAVKAEDLCEVFDLILSGESVDGQDAGRWTPLMYACRQGAYEIARQLLDSGANPDVHGDYDLWPTPLCIAAERGDFDLVRLLIAHGANPNIYAGPSYVRAEAYARWNKHHHLSEFLLYHEDKKPQKR